MQIYVCESVIGLLLFPADCLWQGVQVLEIIIKYFGSREEGTDTAWRKIRETFMKAVT